MATDGTGVVTVYGSGTNGAALLEPSNHKSATFSVKVGLAQMLRGGVIMDVVTPEQARIAEEAGACAVMALERVPADIRAQGGVARMSDPGLIRDIKRAVTIPVMAKARIGHFVEAQILEAIGVDYVDESEVLTLADDAHHINKHNFRVPFVCGALMMQLGCDGVFVGSGIFKSGDPARRARAIVQAVTHYSDPKILAEVSSGLGEAMVGINLSDPKVERFAARSE
uniref:PdxS/SNZ N-terminal domain-containing protein n=1 Tax=Oryza rufipogon TaxID=4529 RepID=A0A0E0Q309_ORYRU